LLYCDRTFFMAPWPMAVGNMVIEAAAGVPATPGVSSAVPSLIGSIADDCGAGLGRQIAYCLLRG
jgi:hypothetical protein